VRRAVNVPGVRFIEQAEQKGTGHAVRAGPTALTGLDGYLMVLYGDCPLLRAATLRQAHRPGDALHRRGHILTAIMDDPTGYAACCATRAGAVYGVVEQKAGTPEQLAAARGQHGDHLLPRARVLAHVDEISPTIRPRNTTSPTWGDHGAARLLRGCHADPRRPRGAGHQQTAWNWPEVDRLLPRPQGATISWWTASTIEKPRDRHGGIWGCASGRYRGRTVRADFWGAR